MNTRNPEAASSASTSGQITAMARRASRWRAATIFCVIVLAFVAATGVSMFEQFKAQINHLHRQLVNVPQIKYVAVLNDSQAQAFLLVTMDPQERALALQRVGSATEGREESLQLWALPATGRARSLGLLGSSKTLRIPATEADLLSVSQLGVSVEPKGGVADDRGPSGPMLFKGALLQKAL